MCLISVWRPHILPLDHQVPINSIIQVHLKLWMNTNCFVQGMFIHRPDPNAFLFSSPEQHSWRAIVLTSASASASANVKVFVKVFKTSLFPNLITDLIHLWYDDTYWSKILRSTIRIPLGQEQGHGIRIFMLKFYVKVFKISLLLNQMMDLVPIWCHVRYWSKVFISTISTHGRDLEVEVQT